MGYTVVIPARFASTRLPGKPLLDIAGKPMLQHVYERACESAATNVIIATDDTRIVDAAEGFGAEVMMTSIEHRSGSERAAEVVERRQLPTEHIVVNLQGDEPLMPPALLDQVASNLATNDDASMATLCEQLETDAQLFDPNVVKVVLDYRGYALYFSRAPLPWDREEFIKNPRQLPDKTVYLRHVGVYAYRADFLQNYPKLTPCALEKAESLEQLRALYHGYRIHVAEAQEGPGPGVDTPEDLERVRSLMGMSCC